jgi:branched-chain amino acid transport system ATP-binding protein
MLSLTDVHAGYGRASVLHGVNLEVRAGEVVSLLGANGAGKSTTLKTISGVVRATRGALRFDGRDITAAQPGAIVKLGLVHCPEGRQVFPDLTVQENLQMGAYARGSRRRVDKVMETFPALRDRLRQPAGTLSGGEQQMLAIGRALMAQPRLLLLDEPSLGLAPLIVEGIFRIIARFRDEGVSVLLVEQNAALALAVADRAYVLSHGEVRHAGSAQEVKTSEALRRAYLG